jgi:hypothetical protein
MDFEHFPATTFGYGVVLSINGEETFVTKPTKRLCPNELNPHQSVSTDSNHAKIFEKLYLPTLKLPNINIHKFSSFATQKTCFR